MTQYFYIYVSLLIRLRYYRKFQLQNVQRRMMDICQIIAFLRMFGFGKARLREESSLKYGNQHALKSKDREAANALDTVLEYHAKIS